MPTRRDFVDRMLGSAALLAPLPYLVDGGSFAPWGAVGSGDVYDVTDYGADPSGATDSTAGFQNALDSVPVKGGLVVVPPGRYRISSTVVWPPVSGGSDVLKPAFLRGWNPSVIKGVAGGWSEGISAVEFTGSGPLLDLRLGKGTRTRFGGGIGGLALHGPGTEGTTGVEAFRVATAQFRGLAARNFGVNVRVADASFYSVWESCLFSDAVSDGAQFRGAVNGSGFHRLRFAANGRHGVSLQRGGVPVYFDGCWFEGNGACGVRAVDATHLRVVGSYFEGNKASSVRFRTVEGGERAGSVSVVDCYFRPVADGCCLDLGDIPARARLLNCVVNGDHAPRSVVKAPSGATHSLVAIGGSRDGETPVALLDTPPSHFRHVVALGDAFAGDDRHLGSSHVLAGGETMRLLDTPVEFAAMTTDERPDPGRPGRVIFNSDEGALNVDDGHRWVRPGGRGE